MGSRTRLYLALAVMLAIPAKSALATSEVEAARAQEPAAETTAITDPSQGTPESPLAIASSLTMRDSAALRIELGSAEPGQRDASLLGLAFEISPQP